MEKQPYDHRDPQLPEPRFMTPEEIAAVEARAEQHKPKRLQFNHRDYAQLAYGYARTYWKNRKRTIPLTLIGIAVLLLLVPASRYNLLGLVISRQTQVRVLDSATGAPVSGASVTMDGKAYKTDANGVVRAKVSMGGTALEVKKQYYQSLHTDVRVVFSTQKNNFTLRPVATGRLVPVRVTNTINGKPLAGAELTVLGTSAKTAQDGTANIVLPAGVAKQKVHLALTGYNSLDTTLQVTNTVVAANTFELTPVGKVYFLSKRTGKINVMKSNLDGTDASVVLAASGSESDTDTILLASQDWKYLVLKSQRNGTDKPASLYLIDTTHNDTLTVLDEGDADFTLAGWSGHRFIYTVLRNQTKLWESNRQSLKSYDADSGKLSVLDSTQASGSGGSDSQYELLGGVSILANKILYVKTWQSLYYGTSLAGRQHSIMSVSPDGQNKKLQQAIDATAYTYINAEVTGPNAVYFNVAATGDGAATYYEYEDDVFARTTAADAQKAGQDYTTYLVSPSGKKTFWYQQQDGKNVLFVGDADGKSGKEIASLEDYVPYGWFTDNYLLVSKDDSQLFIYDTSVSQKEIVPLKITDYHKPAVDFSGYGRGYGGF